MTIENQVFIDSSIHEQESSSCIEIISETKNAEAFINFNEQGLECRNKETEERNETNGTLIENLNDKLNTETINDKEQYNIGDVDNDVSVEEIQLDELLPENHNDGSVTSESQHVDENSSLKTLERSPEKYIPDNTGNTVGEKIQTLFRKSLFWPIRTSNEKVDEAKRKIKEKILTVVR
ncbi:hypothetical protein JTB14_001362 [Gonioctena quinquepunctata]|nr:hypothetical protein JTB14_001362 [Gonioctena quinquepunctata]